ncbi:MAG: hypothetical protein SWK90_11855 [Chloroflexota bacterium]|nr:hypothetical protein [Chloroflexota bacterium]
MSKLEAKQQQIKIAQQTLNTLEKQAAGYTTLTIPATLQTELDDQRKKVTTLEAEIKSLEKTSGQESVEEQLQPPHIPFQNREDEIRDILSFFAPPYILLDAPAGYGKSVLLERLAERFTEQEQEQEWKVAHVRLEEDDSLHQLVAMLAQRLGLKYSPKGADAYRWGADLAGALKRNELEAITRNGLVFLIDLEKKPALNVLKDLLDQFIPAVQKSLRVLEFFSIRHNRFRVVLAGRCLAGRTEATSHAIPLSVRRLTPFDYSVVRETVRAIFAEHADAAVTQIAAHLMYLTGGHPGCLAHSLRKYEKVGCTPDDFLKFCSAEVWSQIVRPVGRDVRDSVPQNLCRVLDRLSVFRYLDYPLLDRLTGGEEPIVEGYDNGYDLADRLTGTYMMSWQGRLLQDDITRRLLLARLRKENTSFPEWCRQAQGICADHLQRPDTQSPEVWAIEYLYQILQEHAGAVHDPRRRAAMRDIFFTTDVRKNEVRKALQWLVDGRQGRAEQQALNQALEADWEFRFTISYFLREKEYSDGPFKELQEHVSEFFTQNKGGKDG